MFIVSWACEVKSACAACKLGMGQRVRDHKARALRRLEEMQLEHGGDDVRGQHKHPVLRRKKHSSQEAPKLACDPLLVGIRRFSSSTSNTHGESPSQSTMSSSEVFASPCCVFRKAWNFDEAAQSLSRTQFELREHEEGHLAHHYLLLVGNSQRK